MLVRPLTLLMILIFLTGCATLDEKPNFVSFAEGIEGRVTTMVNRDPVLAALIARFDPRYQAFHDGEDACYYPVGPQYAGFYRAGKLCRNPEVQISDASLAAILRHEFLHFVWDALTLDQQYGWLDHLSIYPTPIEKYVFSHYSDNHETELFAYTLEGEIRPVDGAALVRLGILPAQFSKGDTTFANRFFPGHSFSRH